MANTIENSISHRTAYLWSLHSYFVCSLTLRECVFLSEINTFSHLIKKVLNQTNLFRKNMKLLQKTSLYLQKKERKLQRMYQFSLFLSYIYDY